MPEKHFFCQTFSNYFNPAIRILFKYLAISGKNLWYTNSFCFGGCSLSSFAN